MNIIPYGENTLLINFEQEISTEINQKVHQVQKALKKNYPKEITFFIPAYCSLTVGFNSHLISFQNLKDGVQNLNFSEITENITQENTIFRIPVCYHKKFALDMEEVKQITQLSESKIIQLHSENLYKVYMIGFLPAFPYLGKTPETLACPRKNKPRLRVSEGSVGLANQQTGIYPSEAPGGWQIIGRTPLKIFDASKENPFLLKAGDRVQFYEISEKEFEKVQKEIK